MTNKAYKTKPEDKEKKKVMKNAKGDPKYNDVKMFEFCKGKECPWCRNVNFGNGVHVPHCVLRGGEVRPHDRCKYLNDCIDYMKSLHIDDGETVEVERVSVDVEEEEED